MTILLRRFLFTAVQATVRRATTRSWLFRSIRGRVGSQRDTIDELDRKTQALTYMRRLPGRKLTGGSGNLMALKDGGSAFRASDCKTWRVGGNQPSDSHLLPARVRSPLVTIYRHIPFCAQAYVDDLAVGVALKVVLGQSHSSSYRRSFILLGRSFSTRARNFYDADKGLAPD